MALRHALEVDNLISVNPAQRIKLPRSVPNTPAPYTTAELNTLLETAKSHRLYFYFRLSAYTGARRGELIALRWTDFDGNSISLNKSRVATKKGVVESNRTKGGLNYQRRVPLDAETIAQVARETQAEVNSLKKALEKYGEHDVGCALLGTHEPCSCGLDNILDAITKE